MRYSAKWPEYAKQWDRMVIKTARVAEFNKLAAFAIAHKTIYQDIEDETSVPWWLISVLHRRESDANFDTYLGNGQSLKRKTTLVPKGRGPFPTFEAGATDALHIDGLDAITDWTLEKALYYCEAFNGWGYAARGMPSPYIFGGSNIQRPGKFTGDGVFSAGVIDKQPGCAPMLWMIAHLDPTVAFVRET